MSDTAIQTWGLTKHYGDVQALSDLDLEVRSGEIFGYLGPNGAGKTTTIRLLMGLMRPTRGRAEVLGRDVHSDGPAARSSMGFLPSDSSLYTFMKVGQYLDAFGNLTNAPRKRRDELTERLELDTSRKIGDLSMGNRQKVVVVRALQEDVPVYIVDEPTRGLDPLVQQEFGKIISELRDEGRTVLLSTHVLSEAEALCDRVGILRLGRLVQVDTVADLSAARVRRMTVTFDGDAPAELSIPGVSDIRIEDGTARFEVSGSIDPVIKALAQYTVTDLETDEDSFEESFLQHYESGNGA
jgi:ABC-2 type transport system ATP-binding protein